MSQTFNSKHLKRLAADLNLFVNGVYCDSVNNEECMYARKDLAYYWEELNPEYNVWGGNWKTFKDYPHFERNIWR